MEPIEERQAGWVVDQGTFWLPKANSTLASDIDFGWDVAMWVSVFFFILVIVPMFLFIYKYRRKHPDEIGAPTGHNTLIEIGWTVIPLVVVMGCFLVGFKGWMHASVAPAESIQIAVTAQKWAWSFTYPNGAVSNELHVPRGRPVKMIMSSKDVLHSFYIPEFRVKQDVIPGTYSSVWFEAIEAKETTLFCAEYCGTSHSNMLAKVYVDEEPAYDAWVEKAGNPFIGMEPAQIGEKLFAAKTCIACHSVDGRRLIGPTWKGLFGSERTLVGGAKVTADENYIRESILNPAAKIVDTFAPTMPSFKGQLKDEEIDALIAYMKTLK